MSIVREAQADKAAGDFMKASGLGSHDGIRAKVRSLWLEAWDQAVYQAALELKAMEKHDEANEILKQLT